MDALRQILLNAPVAAVLVGLLFGAGAYFALGLHSRRRLELRSAMAWTNSLKWRDFLRLASNILNKRGLELDPAERQPGDDGFDLLMLRGRSRYIVQCKHGRVYQLSVKAVRDLSTAMNLQGAEGAIILTTGGTDAASRALAIAERVELIDSVALWQQMKPLLGETERKVIAESAERARDRRLAAMCGIALMAGVAGFLFSNAIAPSAPRTVAEPVSAPPAPAAPVVAEAPTVPTPALVASQPSDATDGLAAPEEAATSEQQIQASREAAEVLKQISQMSEAELDARRDEAARLIATLRGIEAASWQAKSTLVLSLLSERLDDPDGVTKDACELLVRFEELRYTRLQLEPAGSPENPRIRWRQCR